MADEYRLVLTQQFSNDKYRFRNNPRVWKDLAKIERQLCRSGTKHFKDLHRIGEEQWTIRAGEGRRLLVRVKGAVIELVRFGEHDDTYLDASRSTLPPLDVTGLEMSTDVPPRCTTLGDDDLVRLGVERRHVAAVRRCADVDSLEGMADALGQDVALRLMLLEEQTVADVLRELEGVAAVTAPAGPPSPAAAGAGVVPAPTSGDGGRVTDESHAVPEQVPSADDLPGRDVEVLELLEVVRTELSGIKEQLAPIQLPTVTTVEAPIQVPEAPTVEELPAEPPAPSSPAPDDGHPVLKPGDVWLEGRGQDRWILSGAGRSLRRLHDQATLAQVIGEAGARDFVARCLAVRPEGGRVWVDERGHAVTSMGGRDVYLGRICEATPAVGPVGDGTLLSAVEDVLRSAAGSTAKEISFALRRGPHATATKAEINSLLYKERSRFCRDDSSVPRWRLANAAGTPVRPSRAARTPRATRPAARELPRPTVERASVPEDPPAGSGTEASDSRPAPAQQLPLFAWQQEAVAAWYGHGCRGIVEAVTGTGKTILGLEAVAHAARDGEKSTVLVPSVDLQDQWASRFETFLPYLTVARLGGKASGEPARSDVTIAVVNSALKRDLGSLSPNSLLVADEVHRYGSEQFQYALRARYRRRLGLTATLERADDAVDDVLKPYFGGSIMTVGFDRAIREQVVAPFRLVMAPIGMTTDETHQYDKLSRQISNGLKTLRGAGALGSAGGTSMVLQLGRLRGAAGQIGAAARQAESGMRERRRLLASLEGKLDAIEELAETVGRSQGAVLFTQSKEVADEAALRLREWGVTASALHSEMGVPERRSALAGLESGRIQALAAPKLLDEGIDVPTVDLGIVMTASRSRRQMVQRLGRIIRRKSDGRPVDFVVLYAEDTVEDPASGAHEGFFDLVGEVATNRLQLEIGWDAAQLR